jgi:hypothetical protein
LPPTRKSGRKIRWNRREWCPVGGWDHPPEPKAAGSNPAGRAIRIPCNQLLQPHPASLSPHTHSCATPPARSILNDSVIRDGINPAPGRDRDWNVPKGDRRRSQRDTDRMRALVSRLDAVLADARVTRTNIEVFAQRYHPTSSGGETRGPPQRSGTRAGQSTTPFLKAVESRSPSARLLHPPVRRK